MILVILFLGAMLLVSGVRGTYKELFAALGTDVPGYIIWGAAILAIGALGLVPGLKPISKGLLALILIVLIVNNYQKILTGFHDAVSSGEAASTANAQSQSGSSNSGSTSSSPKVQDLTSILSTLSVA